VTRKASNRRCYCKPHRTLLGIFHWQNLSFLSTASTPSIRFPRGRSRRASTTPLKLVRFGQDLRMPWLVLGTMENIIGPAELHCRRHRSILYPLYKESCMGSDASGPPLVDVLCWWKRTEAQIFKNHVAIITKITKSTVKMGRLHYFFSPILFRLPFDITSQLGLLPSGVFCHCPVDDNGWSSSWWFWWFWMVKHDVTCTNIIGNLKFKASVVFGPP
jgi:hypothetical protein